MCEAFGYALKALFPSLEKLQVNKSNSRFLINLLAIILDMEAAQVQGLSDAVVWLHMNDAAKSGIFKTDPDILVQFFIKLCMVHFERQVHILIVDFIINCYYTDILMSWLRPSA